MKNDNLKGTLINYRVNEACEVLEDAKKLAESKGSPRSIINRAYYAMFYATLALLVTIDKGSAKHSGVISLGEVTPIDRADAVYNLFKVI